MTQADRDRLAALKKAKKKLILHKPAAEELGGTERHARRLRRAFRRRGDQAVIHALHGLSVNRKVDLEIQKAAAAMQSRPMCRAPGSILASEYVAKKQQVEVRRKTVPQWMIETILWCARKQRVEKIHAWRPQRSRFGELVQGHQWPRLVGRTPRRDGADQHDRRRGQPVVRPICRQRLDARNMNGSSSTLWDSDDRHETPTTFVRVAV